MLQKITRPAPGELIIGTRSAPGDVMVSPGGDLAYRLLSPGFDLVIVSPSTGCGLASLGVRGITMKSKNRLRIQQVEETIAPFRPALAAGMPRRGWIRAIREALGMSSAQLGARLPGSNRVLRAKSKLRSKSERMVAQSIEDMQASEVNGSIKLETLRKVAEAMDCQLVYAIVPRSSLEEMRRTRAVQVATKALGRVSHSMKLEAQDLGDKEEQRALDDEVEKLLSGSARRLWS